MLETGHRDWSAAVFEPEIFGLSSSALWGLTQALVTPTLGFLFLYLMRLPIAKLPFLQAEVDYKPPTWVLPTFAHCSTFALVTIASTNLFLTRWYERELAEDIKPELFLVRELDTRDKVLVKVAVVLTSYDGLSAFKMVANGYHLFSSNRDCVATFQCTPTADQAERSAAEFKRLRVSGGSVYELNKTNSLPHEITLNHYLASGQNYLDVISENSGTGGCELTVEINFTTAANKREHYLLSILPHRDPDQGEEPKQQGPLLASEVFHAGGSHGDVIRRYKTPTLERRNAVCERIRISMKLTEAQGQALSNSTDFRSHLLSRQKAYICETIGKPIPGCEPTEPPYTDPY
jgi:hypothetical protein